jgi:divalent metal cation (Fe/Co/Zn/Cd) transporter
MQQSQDNVTFPNEKLYRVATLLAFITIGYNLVEGVVSVWFGISDETFTLFGFGLDSFVEVISGAGIWHMLRRQRAAGGLEPDRFERLALHITGGAFYLLAVGLTATALVNIYQQHRPTTTLWGIIVALVSIVSMWLLIRAKVKVGTALASPAILADAACTKACLYLSVVLLAASAGFALTGVGWFDSLGTLGIAWFSVKEGREAFGKARGLACCCAGKCGDTT